MVPARWLTSSATWWARLFIMAGMFAATASAFNVVVLDPGHGGVDGGTHWNGLLEKTLTLDVAKRVETLLRDDGVTTVMTRRSDKSVSLDDRARMANRFPNSLLVSIHFNASPETDFHGHETFYRSESGKRVAESIRKSLAKSIPGKDRGVTNNNFAVLTRTKGVAVLIECAFISNKAEAKRCGDPDFRQKLAAAIARGILRAMEK
jgi:N-acetylmuramoyl-L-alanine amidase